MGRLRRRMKNVGTSWDTSNPPCCFPLWFKTSCVWRGFCEHRSNGPHSGPHTEVMVHIQVHIHKIHFRHNVFIQVHFRNNTVIHIGPPFFFSGHTFPNDFPGFSCSQCHETIRLKTKDEESTRLGYTGLLGELEHLKIETRFLVCRWNKLWHEEIYTKQKVFLNN